jgi:glycerol-3-phosphate cytidylyltransferase
MKGIVAGAFDLIHPGYVRMLKDAKKHCDHLTIALHLNPSLERKHKLKPVQTAEERKEILLSIKYIDDVIFYSFENEYLNLLKSKEYDVRFLGDDYIDGSYTGKEIPIKIIFLNRDHNYSTTELKRKIVKSWR